jgi:[ribosomal protein S5]-alanine N-acetyltransferase
MLALPFVRPAAPILKGQSVTLRLPVNGDFAEWAALRHESRKFLQPWEPRWAHDELERAAWRQRLRRYRDEHAQGSGIAFFIFEAEGGALAGGISIGHIRHGVAQNGQIGYWMGERFAGRGLMREALSLIISYGFDTLHMHRLEAACIPANERSVRLLEKAGFRREGLLRSYLRIDGVWQDHLLYALIAGEQPATAKRV